MTAPTKPGFYWVMWDNEAFEPGDPAMVVELHDGGLVTSTCYDGDWNVADFDWLHPNPLTPPGPARPNSGLPRADYICVNCGGRAYHHASPS